MTEATTDEQLGLIIKKLDVLQNTLKPLHLQLNELQAQMSLVQNSIASITPSKTATKRTTKSTTEGASEEATVTTAVEKLPPTYLVYFKNEFSKNEKYKITMMERMNQLVKFDEMVESNEKLKVKKVKSTAEVYDKELAAFIIEVCKSEVKENNKEAEKIIKEIRSDFDTFKNANKKTSTSEQLEIEQPAEPPAQKVVKPRATKKKA